MQNSYPVEKLGDKGKNMSEWVLIKTKFDHADFVTHANYLEYIRKASGGLRLKCKLKLKRKAVEEKKIKTKVKLIKLTLENLKEEFQTFQKYPEYSVVCTSWIPVKSYYLFFTPLVILEYLITLDIHFLETSHKGALRKLKNCLKNKELTFNISQFNKIHEADVINGWKIPPWENVKRIGADPDVRYKQIIKKLLSYKKEDFKRGHKIKRLAGDKKKEFISSTTVNLCEFLYLYRIKANYRDMEFVDKGVPTEDFKDFYTNYYNLTLNFYRPLRKCINNLAQARFGKSLIN